MSLEFLTSSRQTTRHPLSGLDMFSQVLTVRNTQTGEIVSQHIIGPNYSKAGLNDETNLKIAEIRAAVDGTPRVVTIQYGTEKIEIAPNGTRTNLTKEAIQRELTPAIRTAPTTPPGTVSSINNVTGSSQDGFSVSLFDAAGVNFNVPSTGLFDVYINNQYVISSSRPNGVYKLSLNSIKNFDMSSPATINFVYPATGVDPGGNYTASFTISWAETVGDPITVSQITSVNGGGSGFAVSAFGSTSIDFSVPTTSFDVYIDDTYSNTSSRPNGILTLSINNIKLIDSTSPAKVSFVFPSTGEDAGGVYTSTFTVSWVETLSNANQPGLSTDDAGNIVIGNLRTEEEAINIVESTLNSQSDGIILDWWEREVRPELDRLANSLAQIESDIIRLRDLADKEREGTGIITTSPFGYLGNAILYQLYVKQAQILEEPSASPERQVEALAELNSVVSQLFDSLSPSGPAGSSEV